MDSVKIEIRLHNYFNHILAIAKSNKGKLLLPKPMLD